MTRSIIESYLVFRYLIIDTESNADESKYRLAAWNLHGECERLKMLALIGSTAPEIDGIKQEIDRLRNAVRLLPAFLAMSTKQAERLLAGDFEIPPNRAEAAREAGISGDYYRATYKYVSNYAHTHPFSLTQLQNFDPRKPESFGLMQMAVNYCTGYLALALRDFGRVFSDLESQISSEVWHVISMCEFIVKFDKNAIVVVRGAGPGRLKQAGVYTWPIWEKEVLEFQWHYDDDETCYLLEGDVTVTPEGGQPVHFGKGDLVTFPQGMSCVWKVHKPVRKHYKFG